MGGGGGGGMGGEVQKFNLSVTVLKGGATPETTEI